MSNKKTSLNNFKLGIFVMAGLVFLVLLLYFIGRNRNLFGSSYSLRARFVNVQGLKPGNNVRYSGIDVGTVKSVSIFNDSLVEVRMILNSDMRKVIHSNAVAWIGTDGFVGNKVLNIIPSSEAAPFAKDNDVLASRKALDTDEMLRTLSRTNGDAAVIASELKQTIQRINASEGLWSLLNDQQLPAAIRQSALNIQSATARANSLSREMQDLLAGVKAGQGSLGILLKDSSFAQEITKTASRISSAAAHTDSLVLSMRTEFNQLNNEIISGNGTIHTLLKDSSSAARVKTTLLNIEAGTDNFNQNMEALKHSFLLRGYFRKQAKTADRQKAALVNKSDSLPSTH